MKQKLFRLLSMLSLFVLYCSTAGAETEKNPSSNATKDIDIVGTSYTIAGAFNPSGTDSQGIIPESFNGTSGLKLRATKSADKYANTIRFTVNPGYIITKIEFCGYSNSSTTGKYSKLVGVYVDDHKTNSLLSTLEFPIQDKTNKQTVYSSIDGFAATQYIDFSWEHLGGNSQVFLAFKITYEVAPSVDAPTISSTADGIVTITKAADTHLVYYTTDGTVPSSTNGTEYTEPFVVADGTTVKAVAVDGTDASNVVTKVVYHTGIVVTTPEINSFNGTVSISCATPGAKVEYSTDGGITYKTYERSFLLTEDAEVKVRASREGCTTSEASANVTTIPAGYRTRTVRIGWGSCNLTSKANADDGYSTLTGKEDDADAKGGYILKLMNNAKEWSSSGVKIKILNGDEKTGIKLSNGAQNIIKLPKGVKATRLTLYSYCNYSSSSSTLGWKEINGVDYSAENAKVPMDRYSDYANKGKDPDIRVYPLDNVTGEISFTNSGNQLAFVIELDVIEPIKANVGATGYASYCSEYALDFTGVTALNAYVASAADDGKVSMTKVTQVPANTGLILKSASGAAVSDVVVPVIESANSVGTNLLVGTVAGATVNPSSPENGYNYLFGKKNEVVGFYKLVDNTYNLGVNKAYLHTAADITPAMNSAKGVIMDFGDGETTAISNIDADVPNDAVYYNLNGQRVVNPAKGVYILNGKKVMVK